MASENSPHIPAWKKLGLKLKYAKDEPPLPSTTNGTNGTKHAQNDNPSSKEPQRKKRRFSDSDEATPSASPQINGSSKKPQERQNVKKKVSFSAETKTKDGDTAQPANPPILLPYTNGTSTTAEDSSTPQSEKPSKTKTKTKSKSTKKSQPSTSKPKAGLSYLTQFYSDHSSWKFSKNHSTWILKHALDESAIPRSYNFPLACYLYNLQSTGARQRLTTQCEKARLADDDSDKVCIDHKQIAEFLSAVKLFVADPQGFDKIPAVSWAEEQKRTDIFWWVLHPDGLFHPASATEMRTLEAEYELLKSKPVPSLSASDMDEPQKRRNRKKRTGITAADLSSSSSSSSESESDNSKDDKDDTSSSGSDSD